MNLSGKSNNEISTMDPYGGDEYNSYGNTTTSTSDIIIEDWPTWMNVGIPLVCVVVFTVTIIIIYLFPNTPKGGLTTFLKETDMHDGRKGRTERSESVPLVQVHEWASGPCTTASGGRKNDPVCDSTGGRHQPKSAFL